MVSKTEEEQVNRLENQVENGGGGAWEYLCLVRKLKLRRSDKVLKHGFSILNDPKKRSALGPEGRLEAMLLEAKGLLAEAEKAYSSLLEENQFDQVIHKRRVAIAKAQGNLSGAIEWLNKYLEMYKQAAFCYEELILSQPTIPLYHLAYADVLYTLGGLENLHAAKKYYAATIDLTGGKNIRALFGICLCASAVGQLAKGRNKEDKESSELQSLSAVALEKLYKQQSPSKLSLLTSTLRNFKL
ncbi:hypothetical protein DH2020_029843 [Rehmannia glutinosa]|uniref:ER membrane protein complex subunit 2 n=1 Tax=Rehmannia glutinosa TaxID=99300 RepID=A0ABR0VR18_REHGL